MKKMYFFAAVLLWAMSGYAQDDNSEYKEEEFKTIFGGKSVGGYGGIGLGYSQIDSRSTMVFNARGGVVLGHILSIGLGGNAFVNNPKYEATLNRNVSLVGGYGGLYIEPIVFPRMGIHVSFPVIMGLGGVAYTSYNDEGQDYENNDSYVENSRTYFVLEPAAELEFNLTKFMRMAAYVSYRLTTDLDWDKTSAQALSGFAGGIIFKFGKF